MHKGTTIVQVAAKAPMLLPDKGVLESLAGLENHPGFQFLLQRLDLAAAYLDSRLRTERHADIRAVDTIQQGIAWCNWVKQQVIAAQPKMRTEVRQAEDYEEALFKELDKQLIRLGAE